LENRVSNVAFGQAAVEHIDALYGYAMTLTRDPSEAEDLVQETYVRAARATKRPAGDRNFNGWLFFIIRNAWLNQVRNKNSRPKFLELE
jgi:RNA polymerase sigma-70 factor (ECF subfamily)